VSFEDTEAIKRMDYAMNLAQDNLVTIGAAEYQNVQALLAI